MRRLWRACASEVFGPEGEGELLTRHRGMAIQQEIGEASLQALRLQGRNGRVIIKRLKLPRVVRAALANLSEGLG